MSTAVVLGGGISGLSAAYYLRNIPKFSKVLLLEGNKQLGGWLNTTQHSDGATWDHGPQSIRATGKTAYNTLTLMHELGLENDILPVNASHPGAANRFIYYNNQVNALPNSLLGILKKPPFLSHSLLWSILKDLTTKRASPEAEETIYDFINRRFGSEVADVLINSMCRGIFAGDIRHLSLQACFPYLHDLEKQYRSLVIGTFRDKEEVDDSCPLIKKARAENWRLYSLKNGLQQLVETMGKVVSNDPKCEVKTNNPATKIILASGKAKVHTKEESFEADHVFSALFAGDLKGLLSEDPKPLCQNLGLIPAVNVVVVNLEFEDNVSTLKGFGHLLPSKESRHFLGIIYNSCVFPAHDRLDSPSTRFTVMMGGSWFDRLTEICPSMSESSLTNLAVETLRKQLKISAKLSRSHVFIHKNCIPHYTVGYTSRLNEMKAYIADHQLPLSLIGSSFEGPGINDCIYNAKMSVLAHATP
ncbi:protoporphyrinogen oxidase isoform X1 [Octopus bimaculoides]|uniref:Protoporphyrinogen oxidase n=2 Tax=Octopus bimaculoides TaxID=37653 RepID=A0A0L8H250_OCTBM|nr:protoporphyrinogen oxidase isoform X1 [Octopus bimaculoides]|eukprot:XP_014776030.1 PREDICTED: protoporphyrinogen oxidase-like isoform X1 [Octopus bimaculoides]